jgi:carbon-monoxide dehydrogenase medium subunit
MRYRLARPAVLVDINALDALDYLEERDGALRIGAIARDSTVERSDVVRSRYPLLADAGPVIADPVVRQNGTVVGSLCHNDPAGDWPVVALATRAQIVVRSQHGIRVLNADDFIVDSYTTALRDGEMAVEVRFPAPVQRTSGAYFKLERKVGDFATACAGVQIALNDDGTVASAGIAIGAAGPRAMRVEQAEKLFLGVLPTPGMIRAAMDLAREASDPIADNRGSREYKREMAAVLVGRALRKTFERLGAKGLQAS